MTKGYATAEIEIPVTLRVDYNMTKGFPATYEGGQAVSPPEPPQAEIGRVWMQEVTSKGSRWAQIYPTDETLTAIAEKIERRESEF